MERIPVSQGRAFAIVDDEDYADLAQYRWYLVGFRGRYAGRSQILSDGRWTTVYMHRLVIKAPNGVQVDHANRDPLDNRRSNLRLCTQSLNNANAASWKLPISGYRGVYFDPRPRKARPWRVEICVAGERRYRGRFCTPEEAARAYDAAAREAYGEFATLNFPEAIV